jgi:PAS domain S-box-containing protein
MLRKKTKAMRAPHPTPGSSSSRGSHRLQSHFPGKTIRSSSSRSDTLEAVFATLPDGVAILDQDFVYQKVNPAYTEIYAQAHSQKPEWLVGKKHFELYPDPRLAAIFRQVLVTGQPYESTAEALTFLQPPGGPLCQWDWSLHAWRGEKGRARGLVRGLILMIRKNEQPVDKGKVEIPGGEAQQSILRDSEQRAEASEARAYASNTRLRLTQLLYQHLFESTPDANVIVTMSGEIVAINHQAETLFGYQREELAGQKLDILAPEVQRELDAVQQTVSLRKPGSHSMAVEKPQSLELAARRKDGIRFPTEITLNPVKVNNNLLILCVVRDISLRVQREKKLRLQSALMGLLQDIAVAANEATTVESALQYALKRINQELGWQLGHAFIIEEDGGLTAMSTWSESAKKRFPAVASLELPNDSNHVSEQFAVFKAVSNALRFRPNEGMSGISINTGQPVWMNDLADNPQFNRSREARLDGLKTGLAIPIIAGKQAVGILEFFHNQDVPPDPNLLAVLPHVGVQLGRVIERNRSEEALRKTATQLRMVMTNLPVILWVTDREGRVLMIEGKGVSSMIPSADQLLGKNLFSLYDTRPDILDSIRRALSGEEVHTEIRAGNGAIYEAYLMPYFDVNWAVDGEIGLTFDITERKRMESELEEMKHRLLESVDNERARLAAQLHDGPLQDLFGAYYQIQEIKNNLDDHNQEIADSALQTIQEVNATLRIICGELLPNTLVHLGLEKAIRSHAARIQERLEGAIVHLDLDNDGQSLPHGLRLGLFRIYQQLFNNAMRHSGASDIWLRLRLEPERVLLEVQDNGRGFDNPAHWIDLVRHGKLGLASVLERAEGLNGKLEIVTHPGQGTLARVIAPRSPSAV